ncbi:hypothetical protein SLS62_005471 [Diatrype stigma]|uniref:Inositol polyphosphate-related phosphatase domain-containing protein n=1 Tax=Diatrype stigma TaxID=117547 RepID=A0AAN9URE9_9PEZI
MAQPSPLPTIDTFVLTFNAGKAPINTPVIANHLYNAFGNNATSLPELVVISLQEMAPLAKAFVGSYVLQPYFQRYESAVNLAAAKFLVARQEEGEVEPVPSEDRSPYKLATVRNVGMTGIMLLARDPTALHNIRTTELGFGAGSMANKGAVGLRFMYTTEGKDNDSDGQTSRATEMTFVSTHLQAMEWNLETRNRNWESIVSGLVFEDPKKYILPPPSARGGGAEGEEAHDLLERDRDEAQKSALHDLSIYKPGTHLFVSGDLNYRISTTSPGSGAVFPSLDPDSPDHYARFLPLDQLTAEKEAGRTLHGLTEAAIKFPPTYKLKVSPKKQKPGSTEARDGSTVSAAARQGDGEEQQLQDVEDEDVDWEWAIHRWPGWCDRVLYLDIPWWAKEGVASSSTKTSPSSSMDIIAYDALPAVRTSDHRAVYLRVAVPALEPTELAPSSAAIEAELVRSGSNNNSEGDGGNGNGQNLVVDPRVRLPFPIDTNSWHHRAVVKEWERVLGWSMLVSQSRPAIALFATVLVVGLGVWLYHTPGFF